MSLQTYMDRLPLIAILRGVTPEEVEPIGQALADAGFAIIEVPLNSPRPLESIARLHRIFGESVLVGAGTVTRPEDAAAVAAAGGRIAVMPHADTAVIRAAKAAGMACTPGIATPTEGFAALAAGADALKLFPAELMGPPVLKALRSVFPKGTAFLPVGGITPDTMHPYLAAGAAGFGLGSALYQPGFDAAAVAARARAFVASWQSLRAAPAA
ncbi:2-dehydro-3-deoxy-6-phosphogalactonate aldolase [Rhodovastum atsumiense]|uniref:2-dehydro-3-deoxy-6-phosphogalactonate aldolase n=1 Tax=Rhodovastum atsumiense TaxID=504468 RepID=A0A5M6IR61_9PROT|nr:2-dehydro-3-deoxy-6-phosphogalactonate aldolase [Rhodovastum atsumiense]KAA5610399.1 2-dehydro-3-deoxy-6-phosphogalactonate aldolase [Rhodovastum atsumiense]CAH2602919.1 2-dehydro-3-deoxy-6-phosphogalactonate aldolase [Rhodovastum atsumiense]